jgi:type II secretory pathway component PulC
MPLIDWDKLYRKSFVYNSVAAVICGYFVADLLVASLMPWFPPIEAPRPRMNITGERHDYLAYSNAIMPAGRPNLFNEKGLVPNNDEGGSDMNGVPVKTSLPLNLLGVIILNDFKKNVASVEDKTANNVVAVRLGEPISHDTIVQEITDDRVVFMNNASGRREYIELPKDQILATRRAAPAGKTLMAGVVQSDDGHVKIAKPALDQALGQDLKKILQGALCVPASGGLVGFTCKDIDKGSIYEMFGLQNGDTITEMDGEKLANPMGAMQKFGELKTGQLKHVSITIVRDGRPFTKYFDFD